MAAPVAIVGADQEFAHAALPTLVTLDGTASIDPDGDPIDAYLWTPVDIPPGSAAVLNDPTAAQPTFTADVPGTYLYLLQVTAGGQTTEGEVTAAPSSAIARVSVTTQHRALTLPAAHERAWADRMNANLAELDALAGDVDNLNVGGLVGNIAAAQAAADAAQADADANAAALAAHAADDGAHYGPATDAALGVVRLSAPAAAPADPVVVVEDDADWQTLTAGGTPIRSTPTRP
ncbi:MAG: hypothetical protein KC613_20830 [Myxococcales bacterium]|nr:hypothetical protein [Myxococcales bacterium]